MLFLTFISWCAVRQSRPLRSDLVTSCCFKSHCGYFCQAVVILWGSVFTLELLLVTFCTLTHFVGFEVFCWGSRSFALCGFLCFTLMFFLCHFVHLFCAKRHKFLKMTKNKVQNNSQHAKGPQTHTRVWTLIFPSGFSGAGGDLAARWFACWAMSRRAASRGSMRKSSEVFLGQWTTGTRSRKLTRTMTWTGPGAALMVRPVWMSPGHRSTALSWRRATPSCTVGNRLLKGRVRSN